MKEPLVPETPPTRRRSPADGLRHWLEAWRAMPLHGLLVLTGFYTLALSLWLLPQLEQINRMLAGGAGAALTPGLLGRLLLFTVAGTLLWLGSFVATAAAPDPRARWRVGAGRLALLNLSLPFVYSLWLVRHQGRAPTTLLTVALFAVVASLLLVRQPPPPRLETLARRWTGRVPWLFLALGGAFVLLVGSVTVLRHQSFNSNALDMAMMDQLAWNTARGQFLTGTLVGHTEQSYLGHHFSPVLGGMGLLYRLWPGPEILLLSQVIAIAVAAGLLFDLARRLSRSVWLAAAVAGVYLLHPLMHQALLFDFHQDAWASLLLALGLWGVVTGHWRVAALGWLLGVLAKEDVALYWTFFALFSVVREPAHRRRWLAFALLNVGVLALLVGVLAPRYYPTEEPPFSLLDRYTRYGTSLPAIIWNLATNPVLLLTTLLEPARFWGGMILLLPLLPLLWTGGAATLLLLAPLLVNLLSSSDSQYAFQVHYAMLPLTLLAAAAALAAREGATRHGGWSPARHALFAGSTVLFLFLILSPLGLNEAPRLLPTFRPDAHDALARRLIADLPPDASVVAQNTLVPHLSQRARVTLFGRRLFGAPPDYILLDTTSSTWPYEADQYRAELLMLLDDPDFGPVYVNDGFLLLQRGASRERVEEARSLIAAP